MQLAPYVGAFSARGADRPPPEPVRRDWRAAHPAKAGTGRCAAGGDARAWAEDGGQSVPLRGWSACALARELARLGYRDRDLTVQLMGLPVAGVDGIASSTSRSPSWRRPVGVERADIRGAVEQRLATLGLVADPAARCELADDLTRALSPAACRAPSPGMPSHIRASLSAGPRRRGRPGRPGSPHRAAEPGHDLDPTAVTARSAKLDVGQAVAVAASAGERALVVIEGAAGAGKTIPWPPPRTSSPRKGGA
jgi:hypothetical protein